MAKFKLSRHNYTLIPEGTHIFTIEQVIYNEAFGKMDVKMSADDGQYKHSELFNLLDNKGQPNDKAMNAFTFLAKCALQDFESDEFDEQELVGCKFEGDVTHWVSDTKTDEDGNPRKYANISKKRPLPKAAKVEETAEEETSGTDVDDLLASLGL